MVSEAGDVQVFLAQHPPFNHLSESQLEFASNNIFVAFSKSGNELSFDSFASDKGSAKDDDKRVGMVIVRSGSLEVRTDEDVLVDRLSAGDYLVPSVLLNDKENNHRVLVLEDCLYYELSNYAFKSLTASNSEMAALCDTEIARIIQSHVSNAVSSNAEHLPHLGNDDYLSQMVKDMMSSTVITVGPQTTIHQAARLMKQHRISSILVKEDERLAGILTDRDFRSRVLANNVSSDEPVSSVMTSDPMCIDVSGRLHDAHLRMMSEGIHHLPVVKDKVPVGIITLSDILRANNIEPLSLIRAINRSYSVDDLSAAADRLPDLVVKLIERDTRAIEVGKIITSFSDGITKRLLRLAEKKFGPAPCGFAWLAFGSQARQEQVLGSDQDNGLLLPDGYKEEYPDAEAYFKQLAEFVNDGLAACGMPYCPGEIMAKTEKWRQSLSDWKQCFAHWIEEPSPKAVMHSSIFFDMRHIAGDMELMDALKAYVTERAQKNSIFLAMMCDNALKHSPPLGFFKTFVLESDGDHNNTLDLKKRGTIPIVDIARNYTLAAGLKPLNTIERLQAMEQAGAMSKEMAYSLIDAHEFIAGIRLEGQGKQYRANVEVNNYLDPKELSPLVRHQIKEAFNVVREAQSAMRVRFGGGVI